MRILKIFDIEANNLLNEDSIDYTASPYRLKEDFEIHCIVVEDYNSGNIIAFYNGDKYIFDGRPFEEKSSCGDYVYKLTEYDPIDYEHRQLDEFPDYIATCEMDGIIAHNSINYDLLVCKLYFGMDFQIEPDLWHGREVEIIDTLVVSKLNNPDRFGGHGLERLAECAKQSLKLDFRKTVPKDIRFRDFAADMLYYNIGDTRANKSVYDYLMWEARDWDWKDSLALEKKVKEIITYQEHRGFAFAREKAEQAIKELDQFMAERRGRVNPLLPPKPATKSFMKNYTPPKLQFKKDGSLSANMVKFVDKIGATINTDSKPYVMSFNGKNHTLPLAEGQALLTEQVADIDDSTHIKDWLCSLGWKPSEYKEKDLTVKHKVGVGKIKRTEEEFEKAVDAYVIQTLSCHFKRDRLRHLGVNAETMRTSLLKRNFTRPVKVLTNPNFTVGQDKELCPDLERLIDDFPYVKDVVEYLTYKHRRNSILGGGLDWDEEEEADKGYLAYVREDGRIPTPADSCGAATSRFKHKIVANIPRITSLYGDVMRGLFGVDDDCFQVGYDFDSLEARIEAHYCWRYDQDKEYCNSLIMAKPHDVHTKTAAKISEMIGKEFKRSPAKSVKYACTYGAMAAMIAKTIGVDEKTGELVFDAFWEAAAPLKTLKDKLSQYWEKVGNKEFILGIDGRKIPTRSAHAILNSLFQSAGVICAKRAMVIHHEMIKEHGMHVDFFKDDWRNADYIQQLIAYHDESQLEQKREGFKFKMFATEEEASVWKEEQEANSERIYSDIGHNQKGYYVAWCLGGELASKAARQASEYYGLNVDLTAGYMVGQNWGDCH